ncbi:MAG TPA: hypothetical protein VJY83_00315 [Thiopseudomonas sp.]|nr:hypothetical protein [Thiopseudomonas sp.]
MLKSLISRGDQVAIIDGILQIQPASGKPVPDDWYSDNKQRLITEIAKAVSVTTYCYTGYTVGKYDVNGKGRLADGVTLQFVDVVTGENPHAIFNAELKRVQASKCGKYKAGSPLKKKRFTPPATGAFCQFIERSGLPKPRYLSESSEKMGQLKKHVFTMSIGEKGKAINETLITLSVTYADILKALNIAVKVRAEIGGSSGRVRETIGQEVRGGNSVKPDDIRLTDDSSCVSNSVRLKLIRKDGNRGACIPLTGTQYRPDTDTPSKSVKPQDQSLDDWLADYGS